MMDILKCFPEGIAKGDAFINRIDERSDLIKKIKANKHCVLMAPRRYGKTSLVTKVSEEMGLPYCTVDLLAAYSMEYVRDQLVGKISKLVFELSPLVQKAKDKILSIFKKMKPEIYLGAFGQRLKLNLTSDPLQDITDLLLKLDETAKHFKKRAVIFIDEFQQISQLKKYHSIEASIRHAVERSERITYIFSGSNRHLLEQMFGDQGRPLYRLCQTIHLERMHEKAYIDHLRILARERWGKAIPKAVMEKIFQHTELHPFYMNVLCQILWEQDRMPSGEAIDIVWHNYVKTQRTLISHDMTEVSPNQRKIMIALSQKPTQSIQSSEFTAPLRISASSAQQAAEVLMRKDLICKDKNNFYDILDPAVKYYLSIILSDD